MKTGACICHSKQLGGMQFNVEFTVVRLNLLLNRSVNPKKEKKGIENHKRNVWDMCGKNADCKHEFFIFS